MRLVCLLLLICSTSFCAAEFCAAETFVYLGTYTRGDSTSEGIYVATLDEKTGALSKPKLAAESDNPSFVTIHPNKQFLYAISETPFIDDDSVGIVAYSIQDDGSLVQLNERSTKGGAACHVSVDPSGRCIAVANYTGGSCASFLIRSDGSLGEMVSFQQHVGKSVNTVRQNEPHAHSINFCQDGTQAFVADLGTDKIVLYDVDPSSGSMTPSKQKYVSMPKGGGPRHFCFDPSFTFALSNLELTSQVAILAYSQSDRTLTLGSTTSTLPNGESVPGNSTAECLIHPNGTTAYVSNRGHNSVAVLRINDDHDGVSLIQNQSTKGETPRGFGISPSGKYLVVANQNSGNVLSFEIDSKSGKLSATGSEIKIDSAVNVRFLKR